jgi:hypothetical protein
MKQYVYQIALRRADNEKKQFIIERDMVYTETPITEEQGYNISQKYECDIEITLIGILTPTKKEVVIKKDFNTKEMISKKLVAWKTPLQELKEISKNENNSI